MEQRENNSVWIGQPAYTTSLLQTFGMQDCKPVSTPVNVGSKLTKATDDDDSVDQQKYQSAIGSLMYLSVSTRPDISYTASCLARFSAKPTREHWTALKRLLRYLKGTLKHGILYTKDGSDTCTGYTDADWAGDVDSRRSTSGYIFSLSGGAISWRSQKQKMCLTLNHRSRVRCNGQCCPGVGLAETVDCRTHELLYHRSTDLAIRRQPIGNSHD